MKIHLLSDLHLEFLDGPEVDALITSTTKVDADVLVVAGDLAPLADNNIASFVKAVKVFAAWCSKYRHVVYVKGNHEYYGASTWDSVDASLSAIKRDNKNLRVLDNSTVMIEGRRFLGGTMFYAPIRDHQAIPGCWNPCFESNQVFRKLLKEQLRPKDVVVTHHLPSMRCVDARWSNSPTNGYFVMECDRIIAERKPALWLHGHTHQGVNTVVGQTPVRCNPKGHPNENPAFDPGLVIEL